jgi:hypothetical protein
MEDYHLHAVIIDKSVPLKEARHIAANIIKTPTRHFMRETSGSFRFRNIPKTKFKSFFTKVVNPNVSLVFGHLK